MKHNLSLFKSYDYCQSGKPRLTVVMIHGIASNSATYDKALVSFEANKGLADIRFVTFDLLGAGNSLKTDELDYNYDEQIEALHQSISMLKIKTPLILVGHSLGTFIVSRYASVYPDEVSRLILISAPIYTKQDFANPAFMVGMDAFKKALSVKNPGILHEKSFTNSMNNIVLDQTNYEVLTKLKLPIIIIYGDLDQLIASFNIPKLQKDVPNIKAIKTHGKHGVTADKYTELAKILAEDSNVKTL